MSPTIFQGCGDLSYLDVKELSPGGVDRFWRTIVNCASVARSRTPDPIVPCDHPNPPAQAHLSNVVASAAPKTISRLPNTQAMRTLSQDPNINPPGDPQYLLVCINAKHSTILDHIEVGCQSNDEYMFRQIHDAYHRIRTVNEWRVSLLIPSWLCHLFHGISMRLPRIPSLLNRLKYLSLLQNVLGQTSLYKIASADFVRVGHIFSFCVP